MKKCTICGTPETHETIVFNDDGICNICKAQDIKRSIDWNQRLVDLDNLIDSYRGKYAYDLILPFSGGKDSTWTLYYLMNRYPGLRPLVVRFNHGFLRPVVRENCERTFRMLGVDVHEFQPSWATVKWLMLQALLDKGDFCWHCHTGIYAYPIRVALREATPLVMWGEPSTEYTAYYSYSNKEEVNEEQFNRFRNLGITSEDMVLRLEDHIDPRSLAPFTYPPINDLTELGLRSICLGDYVPWDVKRQVSIIKEQLGWRGDVVENVPPQYDYEKIECWMQGARDYIKYQKRGYSRVTHLTAIDIRNGRITKEEARSLVQEYEGKKPFSVQLLLEYLGLTEDQFEAILKDHAISPWKYNEMSTATPPEQEPVDTDTWLRGEGIAPAESSSHIEKCGFCTSCHS